MYSSVANHSLCSFLDSVPIEFLWLLNNLSCKSVVLTVLCRDNIMCGSLNSYVETLIILLRQSFYAASSNWCRDQVFMSRQHFCFGFCYNIVSCIVRISIATQKVYRDRVLSPLNLISCCSFILMLRHGLLVFSMFVVVT